MLKTFVNLARLSSSICSLLCGTDGSGEHRNLYATLAITICSVLSYRSVIDSEQLHQSVMRGEEFVTVITQLVRDTCAIFTMMPNEKHNPLVLSNNEDEVHGLCVAGAALLTYLFTTLSRSAHLKSRAVSTLFEHLHSLSSLLAWLIANFQQVPSRGIAVVHLLLVLSKETSQTLSSIPYFTQALCTANFSQGIQPFSQNDSGAHRCWLLLLSLAAAELRTLYTQSKNLSFGHDFIKTHAEQVKACLQLVSDPKHAVSVLSVQEAALIFELLVTVCGEPQAMPSVLHADISGLAFHTFHGLVSRASLLIDASHFGKTFLWDFGTPEGDNATMATERLRTFARHLGWCHQASSKPAHVVESFLLIHQWFSVLMRNVTTVLRLMCPSSHSIQAPHFSSTKDTSYQFVSDLTRYLSWILSVAELLPHEASSGAPYDFAADCTSRSITARLCALLNRLAPSTLAPHVFLPKIMHRMQRSRSRLENAKVSFTHPRLHFGLFPSSAPSGCAVAMLGLAACIFP